jgi:hypothetical protein
MTPVRFDDRARTLTHSLLTDATRVPSRLPRERDTSAPWKSIAVFAATVLVISGAVAGASIALRSGPVVKPTPASPTGHWKSFQLPTLGSGLAAISCPEANYCVAVDHGGDRFVSDDPGGGAQTWKLVLRLASTNGPLGSASNALASTDMTNDVSCASRSLCVSADQYRQRAYVVISASFVNRGPIENIQWPVVDPGATFAGISCPARTLCVAVGAWNPYGNVAGMVLTSTSPAVVPNVWTPTGVDSSALTAISCPTVKLCVATDAVGDVITSSNPSGGIEAWHVTNVIGTRSFTAISCPTVHFCAAVDSSGEVVTSTNPTGGPHAWTITTLDGSQRFASVSCPSAAFCVVGGLSDSVFVSNDPTGGSAAWTGTRVIPRGTTAMTGLSCPSTRFCVGVDGGGGVHVYTNPST